MFSGFKELKDSMLSINNSLMGRMSNIEDQLVDYEEVDDINLTGDNEEENLHVNESENEFFNIMVEEF